VAIPSFALHDLGWNAFQQLCHTVLREVLGQTVQSFLDNNDAGRDGAFAGHWNPSQGSNLSGQFVVQCKHTARPNHNVALADLNDELSKAERLAAAGRCDVYVLMTNAGLTGNAEEQIAQALKSRGVEQVLLLGRTWFNQTIAEKSALRRLVPRLYGLGDLTQILDERAYRQARAVLDAMRTDLDKLVLTGTYDRAAKTLAHNRFVLLIGAPATGKTTIAAQLALGAADDFDTAVVKLDTISDLQERWNPDERQFFWLDDAFGVTQFDRSLAWAWTTAVPRVAGSIDIGALFVLTSRNYVFHAARGYLKPGAFPLLNEAQVVVDVADLTPEERRQILYNHLRHGRQPNDFLAKVQPYLEEAAGHPGFTPELARRLSDPTFTGRFTYDLRASVTAFFDRPSDFLRDVITGLDIDARAALGLIFINHNWVHSPIELTSSDEDLLARLGSDLGGVTLSLTAMSGSLVQNIIREGESGWVFSHPTMADAYADLLRTPELLHHLIAGFPLEVLLTEVTCGDVGVQGAVIVPAAHFESVLNRLDEPLPRGDFDTAWRAQARRSTFLATRCDREFLVEWLERNPQRLNALAEPGLELDVDPDNELVARLTEYGLFPEDLRSHFASRLIEYCVTGEDPAVVWNRRLGSILTPDEHALLGERIRNELLSNLPKVIDTFTYHWRGGEDEGGPENFIEPLRSLAYFLPMALPNDATIEIGARQLNRLLDDWVIRQEWSEPEPDPDDLWRGGSGSKATKYGRGPSVPQRSIFDDLVEGR
jgi:Restriction endonuclease